MANIAWLDSEVSLITATVLHSVGALGYLAALGVYWAWKRTHDIPKRERLHRTFLIVSYSSIVANFIGGLMRTYLPGHPTLVDIADSPWVQVMLVKHVFIALGAVGLVLLGHFVMPQVQLGKRVPDSRPRMASIFVIAALLISSILGAQAQITDLGPGFKDNDPGSHSNDVNELGRFDQQGTLTTTPLLPTVPQGTFESPDAAIAIALTTSWGDTNFPATFQFVSPSGENFEIENSGNLVVPGIAGLWSYRVQANFAANVAWSIGVDFQAQSHDEALFVNTVQIAPGAFYEINTQMPLGGKLCWQWTSSDIANFDVHSHFDDVVQYYVEESLSQHTGCYTNEREGGYSLLWEPEGTVPITVQLRVWGNYEIESIFPQ